MQIDQTVERLVVMPHTDHQDIGAAPLVVSVLPWGVLLSQKLGSGLAKAAVVAGASPLSRLSIPLELLVPEPPPPPHPSA